MMEKRAVIFLLVFLLCFAIPTLAFSQEGWGMETELDEERGVDQEKEDAAAIEDVLEEVGESQIPTQTILPEEDSVPIEEPLKENDPDPTAPTVAEETSKEKDSITEPAADSPYNTSGYDVLEDGISAIVYNFDQFKETIERDNGIINVHLGADFTIMLNRTLIPSSKATFKLSGRNPQSGVRWTAARHERGGDQRTDAACGG